MKIKRSPSFLIPCAIFMVLLQTSFGDLLFPEEYARKVTARMVSIIQKEQITGKSMPVRTFEQEIKTGEKGITLEGKVKFHSGFVSSIRKAYLSKTGYRSAVTDKQSTVTAAFVLDGVQLVYDIDYDLKDYTGKGNFLLWNKEINFDLDIIRPHNSKQIQAEISFSGTRPNDLIAEVYPDNGYTQLLAKEVKRKHPFREPILKTFVDWETKWRDALKKAVSEFEFPAICYYCPGKQIKT